MNMLDFIGTILITAGMVVVINAVISSLSITRLQRLAVATAVGVWVGLAAAFSASGLFAVPQPFPYIGLFVALPLLATAALAASSPAWRAALIGLPMPLLVGLNIARLVGVLFLLLAAEGRLSGPFPYSAGWGDIAVGALALPALFLAARPVPQAPSFLAGWNILGALDLIVALVLGVTSAPGTLQVFDGAGSSAVLAMPWSFIPTVLVPFFLILHAILFVQLRRVQATHTRNRPITGIARAHG